MPASMSRSRSPNFARSASRKPKRATRKASVAPIELAKDTSTVPSTRPNSAPAANVITAAPGIDSAVTPT